MEVHQASSNDERLLSKSHERAVSAALLGGVLLIDTLAVLLLDAAGVVVSEWLLLLDLLCLFLGLELGRLLGGKGSSSGSLLALLLLLELIDSMSSLHKRNRTKEPKSSQSDTHE